MAENAREFGSYRHLFALSRHCGDHRVNLFVVTKIHFLSYPSFAVVLARLFCLMLLLWDMVGSYFCGMIVSTKLVVFLLKWHFKGESTDLVMEWIFTGLCHLLVQGT